MDANDLAEAIAVLRRSSGVISDNLRYILNHLPELDPPRDLREDVVSMCEEFENALRDVNTELRRLEAFLEQRSGCEPAATARLIGCRLLPEIARMHGVVTRLRELPPLGPGATGLEILVTESAANILYAYRDIGGSLELIAARLK